jgi:hypothetical protein
MAAVRQVARNIVRPRIITADALGLRFVNLFGELGPEVWVTGHHSATPPDKSLREAVAYVQRFHREHAAKDWGGLGYHYVLARTGELLCGRPTILKGAHVGLHNTSNVGVMCIGTVGDRPTLAQLRTFRWLLANAHTSALPKAHRTDRRLMGCGVRGHNDWPSHETNACPATHKPMYLSKGLRR